MEDSPENVGPRATDKPKLIPFHGAFSGLLGDDKWRDVPRKLAWKLAFMNARRKEEGKNARGMEGKLRFNLRRPTRETS